MFGISDDPPRGLAMNTDFEAAAWRTYVKELPMCVTMNLDHMARVISMFHAEDQLWLCEDTCVTSRAALGTAASARPAAVFVVRAAVARIHDLTHWEWIVVRVSVVFMKPESARISGNSASLLSSQLHR